MERKKRKQSKQPATLPLLILLGTVAIVVLTIVLIAVIGGGKRRAEQKTIDAGVAYLESLEAKDPAIVDAILRDRRAQKLAEQKEALLQKLYNGEIDVWSLFSDYVVLGDSRAVGFSYYGFLEDSRVLADGGDTIRKVEERLDAIKALDPAYIYLCYGINDVSIGFWNIPEEYAAEMMEVVSMLNRELPNATVIISSILPALDPAFDVSSKWREIPQYSAAVQAACIENGVIFVDNDKTAKDHADLYAPDGIHLQTYFYDYWGANLITAALEHSGAISETAGGEAAP